MTIARKDIVYPESCRYYHIIGRCVRRAFLCGFDQATGIDYSYRRQWIVDRLETLVQAFCIDIAGYSVMSTHYHLIVQLNPGVADGWTDDEVFRRWSLIYKPPTWVDDVRKGLGTQAQEAAYVTWLGKRRERLGNLSWFMKCLNEPIAKAANREDKCTGSFWEGRFKSQALLSEKALLACLAYVDLNPIRARLAKTPEDSEFTSIRQRIRQVIKAPSETTLHLLPFAAQQSQHTEDPEIPWTFDAYVELVEATGRLLVAGKRGAIPQDTPNILQRLNFDRAGWITAVKFFENGRIRPVAGTRRQIDDHAQAVRQQPGRFFSGYREYGRDFE